MRNWGPPEHDEAWYTRMRGDPAVKRVVDSFIRGLLPNVSADYGKSFVAEADRVATDLTPAYLAAASRAVGYGAIGTSDVIAEGALKDLDGFETVVDEAVDVLTPNEADRRATEATHLAIVTRDTQEDYAEHLIDSDDGYTAGEFPKVRLSRAKDARVAAPRPTPSSQSPSALLVSGRSRMCTRLMSTRSPVPSPWGTGPKTRTTSGTS